MTKCSIRNCETPARSNPDLHADGPSEDDRFAEGFCVYHDDELTLIGHLDEDLLRNDADYSADVLNRLTAEQAAAADPDEADWIGMSIGYVKTLARS